MPLSLVMFDCDGVLIDSEIIAARVEADLLTKAGIPIDAAEVVTRFTGLTLFRIMELLAEETGIAFPEDFAEKADLELDRRLSREVTEIAGVHEILDRIELPRCICSNSSGERLKMTLDHVGLWDRFRPYVFSAVEVGTGKGKPAPDVYLYGAKAFGVAPGDSIVLEDSVHGVTAAAAAGCRVVGFTGGLHSYPGHGEALADAGAETVITRLADFPAVIEAFSGWDRA